MGLGLPADIGFPAPRTTTGFDWGSVVNQAFNSFNTFFTTRRAAQAAPYTGQFYPTPQPNYPTGYNPYAATPYAQNPYGNQGVGFGLDGSGIRLSDGSHIGWLPIVGVVGAFFLLQSRGFQRRGR